MPLLLGKLPSYRRHKSSGQAVVTLGGRDHYLGKMNSPASKAEYNRVTREWLAGGGVAATPELAISELLAAFWRHAKSHYLGADGKPTSEFATYKTLLQRIKAQYGKTPAVEFGPIRLKAFRQSLVDAGLSRGVVNRTISRVRQIFRWGAENELIPASIVEALRCVAGLQRGKTTAREMEPVMPVPDVFVDAVLPYVAPQIAAMIELHRAAGMRSGEVCQMRTIDINMAGGVWQYTPVRHKTQHHGHPRIIYLGPKAQQILRPWLRTSLSEYLFQPAEAEAWRREKRHAARTTPLREGNSPGTNRKRKPCKVPGECYNTSGYLQAVKYGIQRCNREREKQGLPPIPSWHPHQLRHNHATMVRREYGLEVARLLLGHRRADVTEIYAEADQRRAVEAAAKIG
jgi:integrase